MALTDAISVAAKALGFGANVYWKGGESKYLTVDSAPDKPQKEVEADKKVQGKPQGTAVKQTPFQSKTTVSDGPQEVSTANHETQRKYFCEDCTKEIEGYTAKTGDELTTYTAQEVYEKTHIAHGKHLCLACAKKAVKAKNAK